jgi:prepilin-type N-terminal cleavage/methylation domain-containing protein
MNATHPMHIRCGRHGFTLPELLIVITIIVILAALIFAGSRSLVARAHQVTCTSNLRQLGTASIAYAGDHGGSTGPVVIQDGTGINGAVDWTTILVSQGYIGDSSSSSPDRAAPARPQQLCRLHQGGSRGTRQCTVSPTVSNKFFARTIS